MLTVSQGASPVALELAEPAAAGEALRYLPILPFLVASLMRWLVLPGLNDGVQAFAVFVAGLALAEGSAILGFLLVHELRQAYFVIGLIGTAQYMPMFASRYQAREERTGSETKLGRREG